jgi:5-methylcytosine-specific restriction endonuclease McrA
MPYKDKKSEKAKISHSERSKRYYAKNRDNILLKNKTDERRLKSSRINNWKRSGVLGDLNELYEKYISALNCEKCGIIFNGDTKNKCLDHSHKTGEFRFILCRGCNNFDNFLKL